MMRLALDSHETNKGNATKLILLEAHSITLFTKTIGGRLLKYVLETTFGLDKNQIKRNTKSRQSLDYNFKKHTQRQLCTKKVFMF
jgi:hypothetical protein